MLIADGVMRAHAVRAMMRAWRCVRIATCTPMHTKFSMFDELHERISFHRYQNITNSQLNYVTHTKCVPLISMVTGTRVPVLY
jgi:hypothetical protein